MRVGVTDDTPISAQRHEPLHHRLTTVNCEVPDLFLLLAPATWMGGHGGWYRWTKDQPLSESDQARGGVWAMNPPRPIAGQI
jgi:hypothetical protein